MTLDTFLSISEVERAVNLHRSTIYRRIEHREFPAPVQIGRRRVAWPLSEVRDWQTAAVRGVKHGITPRSPRDARG